MVEDRNKALAVGMNAHLSKPINKKALYRLLRDMTTVTQEEIVKLDSSVVRDPLAADLACEHRSCTFDFSAGLAQFDGDQETFVMLLQMFEQSVMPQVHDFITRLDSLFDQEMTEEDVLELRQASHSLKGAISSIAAVGLGKVMSDVHQKLREGSPITSKDVARLHEVYLNTQTDLNEWMQKHSS